MSGYPNPSCVCIVWLPVVDILELLLLVCLEAQFLFLFYISTFLLVSSSSFASTIMLMYVQNCVMCTFSFFMCCVGFDCRCGLKLCSKHRYSDQHNCTFDYKTDGRALLEKAHPAVVAAKVGKL